MSAAKGKELAYLTVQILEAMRNDQYLNLFYKTVKKSANTVKDILTTTVPRRCKCLNYSIFQYTEGNPSITREAYYPETTVDHFKPMYMEAIDAIINSINGQVSTTKVQRVW